MLRNWLTVAIRNLVKHPLFSAINILGLAVGLASCIVIILFVRDEVSYDRWIPDAARIYRTHVRYDFPGRAPLITTSSAGPTVPGLLQDYPQVIESGVRVVPIGPIVQLRGDVYAERGQAVDPSFFQVFDLPTAQGSKALDDPSTIILTERLARKYFRGASAIGETLTLTYNGHTKDMRVTGVLKDLPANSTLTIDFLIPLNVQDFPPGNFENWGAQFMSSFVKLKPGADIAPVAADLAAFLKRHVNTQQYMTLSIMSLPDLHLRAASGFSAGAGASTRERIVAAFAVVAVLILAIASINFTNLATARATLRTREVALRKVVGAHRKHLIVQFIGESILVAGIALAVALVMVEAALPAINGLLQKEMGITYFGAGSILPHLVALVLAVGVLGGTYPAFYISNFAPARILKPAASGNPAGGVSARQLLVVAQFAISIALIICTVVVHRQTEYMRQLDIGFAREGLLVVRELNQPAAKAVAETLRQEIAKIPAVTAVTMSRDVPTDDNNNETTIRKPGSAEDMSINLRLVDYGFFGAYGVPVLAGRDFSENFADDIPNVGRDAPDRSINIIISRAAVKSLGFANPQAAIGQSLMFGGSSGRQSPAIIVGVTEDMRYRSARDEMPPTMYFRNATFFRNMSVRYAGLSESAAREAVGAVWRELVPGIPYRADFMASLIDNQYRAERTQGVMFTAFAVLAVIVAGLGLFGLAAFTAERRTKEIGLRKVLGARVPDVVLLLLWQFSQPVAIANLIAWPVAYFVMRDWLQTFEFRIGLSPLYFLGAGAAALAVAWITIVGHALKVARAKPVLALRYE